MQETAVVCWADAGTESTNTHVASTDSDSQRLLRGLNSLSRCPQRSPSGRSKGGCEKRQEPEYLQMPRTQSLQAQDLGRGGGGESLLR